MAARSPSIGAVPRRSPRYLNFILTGAVVGLLLATAVVLMRASAVERPGALFFYLAVLLTGFGALAGGAVALAVEGRRRS